MHHFDGDAKTCKRWLNSRKVHRERVRSWKKANNTKKAPYVVQQPGKHEPYAGTHVLLKCIVCSRRATVPKTLRNQKPSGKNACGCQCAEQLCVHIDGKENRYCSRCKKYQPLSEFTGDRRTCNEGIVSSSGTATASNTKSNNTNSTENSAPVMAHRLVKAKAEAKAEEALWPAKATAMAEEDMQE